MSPSSGFCDAVGNMLSRLSNTAWKILLEIYDADCSGGVVFIEGVSNYSLSIRILESAGLINILEVDDFGIHAEILNKGTSIVEDWKNGFDSMV